MFADRAMNLYGNFEQKKVYYFYNREFFHFQPSVSERFVIRKSPKILHLMIGEYDKRLNIVWYQSIFQISCSKKANVVWERRKAANANLHELVFTNKTKKDIIFANAILLFIKQQLSFESIVSHMNFAALLEPISFETKFQTLNDLHLFDLSGSNTIKIQMPNQNFLILRNF